MNEIQAANIALSHLRTDRTLQSLTDGSALATTVSLFMEHSRKEILGRYPFQWATRTAALVEHGEDPPGDWTYRYALPSGVIRPLKILIPGMSDDSDEIPFALEMLADTDALTLLTNATAEIVQLRYVTDVPNIESWPIHAAIALTWLLAANMSPSIRGDTSMLEGLYAQYQRMAHAAIASDGNSRVEKPPRTPSAIRARGGY